MPITLSCIAINGSGEICLQTVLQISPLTTSGRNDRMLLFSQTADWALSVRGFSIYRFTWSCHDARVLADGVATTQEFWLKFLRRDRNSVKLPRFVPRRKRMPQKSCVVAVTDTERERLIRKGQTDTERATDTVRTTDTERTDWYGGRTITTRAVREDLQTKRITPQD